jgi:hypothetical protein
VWHHTASLLWLADCTHNLCGTLRNFRHCEQLRYTANLPIHHILLSQQARAWDPTPYIKTSDEQIFNSSGSIKGCKLPPSCSAKGMYDPVKRVHVRTVVHNHDKLYARHCNTATVITTASNTAAVIGTAAEVSAVACSSVILRSMLLYISVRD